MQTSKQRLIAFILIAIGTLAILARVSEGAAWLWVGLAASVFLFTYIRRKDYGILVTGSVLAGVAVGILLEASWGWNGAFLISLGAGFLAIDRVEPKPNHWPLYVAGILGSLGLVVGLLENGILTSIWFALLLIVVGVILIGRDEKSFGDGKWISFNPTSKASEADLSPEASQTVINSEAVTEAKEVNGQKEKPSKRSKSKEEKPSTEPSNTNQAKETPEQETTNSDELKSKLELWRRETAKAEDKAAYLVLTNESLNLIVEQKPQTLKDLNAIKGIGKVKLERYGQAILELVAAS